MIYFLNFIISILFSYYAQKEEKKKWLAFILSFLSIVGLVILAGYRDINIGTDTSAYPVSAFDSSKYYAFNFSAGLEPFYLLLAYITRWFGRGFESFLLLTHALILFFFYAAFWRLRKMVPVWLEMFFFCFLFYQMSLNFSRQMIACGIVYFGFTFLLNRKILHFIIFVIIATLFHKSAIISLLIIPFVYLKKAKYNIFIVLAVISLFFIYDTFLVSLSGVVGFEKFLNYSSRSGAYKGLFSISEFILRIVFLMTLFWSCGKKDIRNRNTLLLFLLDLALNLLQLKSRFAGRISMYFFVLYFYYLPVLVMTKYKKISIVLKTRVMPIKLKYKIIDFSNDPAILIVTMTIVYWFVVFMMKNSCETVPYHSKILGI